MAKMEMWIFCPALNFMTMMRCCTVETMKTHVTNIVLGFICVGLAILIAIFTARFFVKGKSSERGIYRYALAFANSGYMGDPIVLVLFGETVLSYYKFYCLPINLLTYTWGLNELIPRTEQKGGTLKRLLNAPMIAMLFGVLAGLLGIGAVLPAFVIDSLDTLKSCMGPVAMLLAGVTIAKYNFVGMLKKKKVYAASLFRLLFIPALLLACMFVIVRVAGIPTDVLFLIFFAVATPLGLNTVVFPEAYGGDAETGASMTMISHTLGIVSIPLMYALMVALFGTPFGG